MEEKKTIFIHSFIYSSSCLFYLELSVSSVLLLVISFPLLPPHTVHAHTCHMWGGITLSYDDSLPVPFPLSLNKATLSP